jgi:hypothetical protein
MTHSADVQMRLTPLELCLGHRADLLVSQG